MERKTTGHLDPDVSDYWKYLYKTTLEDHGKTEPIISIIDINWEEIKKLNDELGEPIDEKVRQAFLKGYPVTEASQAFGITIVEPPAKKKYSLYFILSSFKYILPRDCREEFAGDLSEIEFEMKKEGYSAWHTRAMMVLNVVNILWVSFRIKYREYFTFSKKTEE